MNMLPNTKSSVLIKTWSRGALQCHEHCPVCGTLVVDSKAYYRQDDYQVMPDIWCYTACADCGSIYLNPHPDAASLPLAYTDYYTHHATDDPSISATRIIDKLVNGYLAWRFGMIQRPHWSVGAILFRLLLPLRLKLDVYGRHIPQSWIDTPRYVLDVGCGNGDFLRRVVEMGFEAVGCEPDIQAAKLCQRQGLNVFSSDAFSPELDDKRFDLITLNHVIEHAENPLILLHRLHALLKPEGLIWLALPNPKALGRRVYGKAWKGFHPPFHLLIPTQKKLSVWLQQVGFIEVRALRRGAQSPGLWRESKRIAVREGCVPPAWLTALSRIGGDMLSTLTPRWGEETIITARRMDEK